MVEEWTTDTATLLGLTCLYPILVQPIELFSLDRIKSQQTINKITPKALVLWFELYRIPDYSDGFLVGRDFRYRGA